MNRTRATADLFLPSDYEADQQPPWIMPVLLNPSFQAEKPPSDGRCTACHGHHFWTEASGQRFGWRCATCIPATRPPDRVLVVDTLELATA